MPDICRCICTLQVLPEIIAEGPHSRLINRQIMKTFDGDTDEESGDDEDEDSEEEQEEDEEEAEEESPMEQEEESWEIEDRYWLFGDGFWNRTKFQELRAAREAGRAKGAYPTLCMVPVAA
jgi:hypothetical protein